MLIKPPMSVSKPRPRALALAALSAVVLGLSIWQMAQRIQAFNASAPRTLHAFQVIGERDFTWYGRPVSLTDQQDSSGPGAVSLRYGEAQATLPVTLELMSPQLPGLLRHHDWLRVLRFIEQAGSPEQVAQAEREGHTRLVVATRRPLVGPHPTSGEYPKKEWAFDFYELKADGTIAKESWFYPKNRPGKDRKPEELPEGSWQEACALHLMPASQAPNSTFAHDAIAAMGWTLPSAALAILGIIGGLTWAWAPSGSWNTGASARSSANAPRDGSVTPAV